jgi:hypothetical protein
MRTNLNAPEPEYQPTAKLIERFRKHVDAVPSLPLLSPMRAYHIYCAGGLHKLLADRALQGDEEAGNVALGAPHWLTFNPSEMR